MARGTLFLGSARSHCPPPGLQSPLLLCCLCFYDSLISLPGGGQCLLQLSSSQLRQSLRGMVLIGAMGLLWGALGHSPIPVHLLASPCFVPSSGQHPSPEPCCRRSRLSASLVLLSPPHRQRRNGWMGCFRASQPQEQKMCVKVSALRSCACCLAPGLPGGCDPMPSSEPGLCHPSSSWHPPELGQALSLLQ